MDDQSNGAVCAGDNAAICTCKLERNANLSNALFNTRSGGDNFSKSFYYVMEKILEDGVWRTLTKDKNP